MKICILTHTFPRFEKDVAAPFMDGVATGMVENKNEVIVLTPFSSKFSKFLKSKKYKLFLYKYAPFNSWHKLGYSETLTDDKTLKFTNLILSPFMFIFGIIALYKLVKKEKIDIINAHWILPNGFIACVVSRLTGTPVVSTLPGSDVYMADRNNLYRYMAKFASETSKAISSNSPQLLADLAKICEKLGTKKGSIQKKSYPIMYGVDPKKFYPTTKNITAIRKKLRILRDDIVVSSVGRLVSKKGYKYLVEAAPKVIKENKKVIFAIFGEGDQRKELEKRVLELGLEDNFRFPGWVKYDEMLYYQNLGDIFILPSIRDEEGNLDDQSVSVVEAMACAKPVITTDFPGYRIVMGNGENGYLVPEKDAQKMSQAIIKLISSPRLRDNMGKTSRELVLNHFSWDSIGKEYTMLFEKLL
jgi:glycosyltransferase involved in cell wall biosynthesis